MNNIKGLVGFLIFSIMLLSGFSHWMGQRMATRYTPLIDAVMVIKLEATTAHLWFEEIISGDSNEKIEVVWEHLDKANWYATAMLEGGKNFEWQLVPVAEPQVIAKIKATQSDLFEFRQIAKSRLEDHGGSSGVGSVYDQKFDKVYAKLIHQADEVEAELRMQMSRSLNNFRFSQITMQLGIIFLAGALFWLIIQYEKLSKELVESANHANREKSEFLSMMSHELRTPMNGVLGMAQILKDTELTSEQQHFCNVIIDSGNSLLRIVSDILDFSKIEVHRESIVLEPFSLETFTQLTKDLFLGLAASKGLVLTHQIDTRVEDGVKGDVEILRRILTNLIGNAVKFTSKGKIEINISLLEGSPQEQLLRFKIIDTGIGIATDKQELIFEPFRQAAITTRNEYGGTGLGLSIVKGLVEMLQGTITVQSDGKSGSAFIVDIPLEVSKVPTPVREPIY